MKTLKDKFKDKVLLITGEPRQRHPALNRPDQGRETAGRDGFEHDAVHDDTRGYRGYRPLCLGAIGMSCQVRGTRIIRRWGNSPLALCGLCLSQIPHTR